MIVYYKLDMLLDERKITKTQLYKDTGISTNVISKISKNEDTEKIIEQLILARKELISLCSNVK